MLKKNLIKTSVAVALASTIFMPTQAFAYVLIDWEVNPEIDAIRLDSKQLMQCKEGTANLKEYLHNCYDMKVRIYNMQHAPRTSSYAPDYLTKSGGIASFNGHTETWYSSNAKRHYRTDEWTPGEDGIYRDKDGYLVVASSDLAPGSTVETSHGTGKVYDSGCASGIVDVYVNW